MSQSPNPDFALMMLTGAVVLAPTPPTETEVPLAYRVTSPLVAKKTLSAWRINRPTVFGIVIAGKPGGFSLDKRIEGVASQLNQFVRRVDIHGVIV